MAYIHAIWMMWVHSIPSERLWLMQQNKGQAAHEEHHRLGNEARFWNVFKFKETKTSKQESISIAVCERWICKEKFLHMEVQNSSSPPWNGRETMRPIEGTAVSWGGSKPIGQHLWLLTHHSPDRPNFPLPHSLLICPQSMQEQEESGCWHHNTEHSSGERLTAFLSLLLLGKWEDSRRGYTGFSQCFHLKVHSISWGWPVNTFQYNRDNDVLLHGQLLGSNSGINIVLTFLEFFLLVVTMNIWAEKFTKATVQFWCFGTKKQ